MSPARRAFITPFAVIALAQCTPARGTRPDAEIETLDAAPRMDAPAPPRDAPRADAPSDAPAESDAPAIAMGESVLVGDVPPDAPALFASGPSDPAAAPALTYPEDGTVIPPNLPSFEVRFERRALADLFELTFAGSGGSFRVYARCGSTERNCRVPLDSALMERVALAAQPGEGVRVSVAARTDAGAVGRSGSIDLGVTSEPLRGGIYYWTTDHGAVLRFEFGLAGASVERYLSPPGNQCYGCHSLARAGNQIALGVVSIETHAQSLRSYLVPEGTHIEAGSIETFSTYSHDGTMLLVDGMRTITVRSAVTGRDLDVAPTARGAMPDWSPDGSNVVLVVSPTLEHPPVEGYGISGPTGLQLMPWDGRAFGPARTLVAPGRECDYYPTFSPDSAWVLFNRAARRSNNQADAKLWLVDARPSATAPTPVRLARADGPGDVTNSWPRFVPRPQTFRGQTLYWFTFSSRRLFYAPTNPLITIYPAQLWMAAVIPSRVGTGPAPSDPSTPAIWLPFQNRDIGNHIAQWAFEVPRRSCSVDADCVDGEYCRALTTSGQCFARE